MNMRLLTLALSGGLIASLLVGCATKIAKSDVTPHDFSAAPAASPVLPVRSIDVITSPALEGTFMYYRLPDSTARNAFVYTRWSAPPAALIAARLKRGLPANTNINSSICHLRLEVDELTQVFSDTENSQLLLEARATLFTTQGLLTRRNLSVSQAAGADAISGIKVSGPVVQQLAQELHEWTVKYCGSENK